MIQSIYKDLYKDLELSEERCEALANLLSKTVNKDPSWTSLYIRQLLKKKLPMSGPIKEACQRAGYLLDGSPPLKAEDLKQVSVYSLNGNVQEGSIILGKSVICPVCLVSFVKVVHNQKRCSKECTRQWKSIKTD